MYNRVCATSRTYKRLVESITAFGGLQCVESATKSRALSHPSKGVIDSHAPARQYEYCDSILHQHPMIVSTRADVEREGERNNAGGIARTQQEYAGMLAAGNEAALFWGHIC